MPRAACPSKPMTWRSGAWCKSESRRSAGSRCCASGSAIGHALKRWVRSPRFSSSTAAVQASLSTGRCSFSAARPRRPDTNSRKTMSYTVSTLLLRNLHDVFGEIDPVRRRTAIDEIFREDTVFHEPNGIYRGRDEIDRIAGVIKATHPDFRYQQLSPPEVMGDGGRVRWVSGSPGKPPAYARTDFIIARDGKIAAVYLFFAARPEGALNKLDRLGSAHPFRPNGICTRANPPPVTHQATSRYISVLPAKSCSLPATSCSTPRSASRILSDRLGSTRTCRWRQDAHCLNDSATTDKTLVSGYHLPFPGFGHVVHQGSRYRWLPARLAVGDLTTSVKREIRWRGTDTTTASPPWRPASIATSTADAVRLHPRHPT